MSPKAPAASRTPLSRRRVVAAALELVDQEGLDALSMRTLATSLGVEAMSLYKHVPNKATLLDLLVGEVVSEMELPTKGTWEQRCRQIAEEYRRVGLAHPEVFTLVATCRSGSIESLQPIDAALGALRSGGFDDATTLRAFWLLVSFMNGSIQGQIADEAGLREPLGVPVDPVAVAELLPNLGLLGDRFLQCDYDAEFAFGLDRVLASLRSLRRARR